MFFVLQTPCAAWVVGFQQSPIVFDEIGGELIGYGQSRNSSLQNSFRQNTRISGEGVTDCKTGCIQLQEISTSLHYFFGVICGNRFDGNRGVGGGLLISKRLKIDLVQQKQKRPQTAFFLQNMGNGGEVRGGV